MRAGPAGMAAKLHAGEFAHDDVVFAACRASQREGGGAGGDALLGLCGEEGAKLGGAPGDVGLEEMNLADGGEEALRDGFLILDAEEVDVMKCRGLADQVVASDGAAEFGLGEEGANPGDAKSRRGGDVHNTCRGLWFGQKECAHDWLVTPGRCSCPSIGKGRATQKVLKMLCFLVFSAWGGYRKRNVFPVWEAGRGELQAAWCNGASAAGAAEREAARTRTKSRP